MFPPIPGAPWFRGAGPLPPIAYPPQVSQARPELRSLLRRNPTEDRRQSRFNDQVSSIVNSLYGQNYLQQTGETSYMILNGCLTGSGAPDNHDDFAHGAVQGCIYVDTTNERGYICLDHSIGNAEWSSIVTSVGLKMPQGEFRPVTSVTGAGTLTVEWSEKPPNLFFGSPASLPGIPMFRALAVADLPTLTSTIIPVNSSTWSIELAITAAAITQAGAYALTARWNEITTIDPGVSKSVRLQDLTTREFVVVKNATAAEAFVFPATDDQINALGVNASYALAAGALGIFFSFSDTQWYGGTLA